MTTSPVPSITDELLAELEQKAKAAYEDREREGFSYDPAVELTLLESRFAAAANPATILALVEHIRSLTARLERARDDSARLNWLDNRNASFRMGWRCGIAPAGCVTISAVIQLGEKVTKIRDAIDAAIAQEGAEHE